MQVLHKLVRFAQRSPREQLQRARATVRYRLLDWGWKVPHLGNDRTTYVIGLFGSGRWYINELMVQHIGERAKYFMDGIRFHPGPTSMIYSGHTTMKHVSAGITRPCREPITELLTLIATKYSGSRASNSKAVVLHSF